MRSSKSRSRNKNNNNNRNRSGGGGGGGNIINRVFDSSGPEGKVRGTPQQIIDKYKQLTSDAQLGNDRVAAENFQQHAEHYTRLLAVAQKEMDTRREQQEREHRERQIARNEQQQQRNEQQAAQVQPAPAPEAQPVPAPEAPAPRPNDPATMEQPDVIDTSAPDSGLVETPEQEKPKRKPRSRKPKVTPVDQPDTPEATE